MTTQQHIVNYAKAGYPGLYIVSHEETRIEGEVKGAAQALEYSLHDWTVTQGVRSLSDAAIVADTQDPVAMLETFIGLPEKSVLIAKDFHAFLDPTNPNPMLVRKVKDALGCGKASNKVLVITGCTLKLPSDLEKLVQVIEFKLPTREELSAVLESILTAAGASRKGVNTDAVLDAASGLTTFEAEDAFALSVIETGTADRAVVQREKTQAVKKSGILELVENQVTLDDIGGLENLKADLASKCGLFTKAAKDYGLPAPRGLLVVGQPGTGKSLTATATSSIFNIPLLRLEAGRLFGSLVGQSEENWRKAFATARAMAPCVLWIDEVDGLFSGHGGQSTDGGTTQRVLKAILQDMQYNAADIFFMFTANDIDCLPDPLIDRLDTWSVDLPTFGEREQIIAIHIAKRGRAPKKFNLGELAKVTEGFSGRQIEQVWLKAMTAAFNDGKREPTTKDFAAAAASVTPTSKLMAEAIERRRKRLQNRAMPASRAETVKASGGRKLSV